MLLVQSHLIITPNLSSLRTIGTYIDILSALQYLRSEFSVFSVFPDLFKWFFFQVSQFMLGILIKTARGNQSIPGYHRVVPKAPALIGEISFKLGSCGCFSVATVLVNCWNQVVGVVLKIINLRSFKTHNIYPKLFFQFFYILNIVIIIP